MPPYEAGTPSFTFINGDPRTRNNISQIRRHAGKSSSIKHTARPPLTDLNHRSTLLPSLPAESPPESASSENVPSSFTVVSRTKVEVSRSRGISIRDLVNDFSESETHLAPPTAPAPAPAPVSHRAVLPSRTDLDDASLTSIYHGPKPKRYKRRRQTSFLTAIVADPIFRVSIPKRRQHVHQANFQRKFSIRPARYIPLSQGQSKMENILSQAIQFHAHTNEIEWLSAIQQNDSFFNMMEDVTIVCSSIAVAADLLTIGRNESVSAVLEKLLPSLGKIFLSKHPQLYWVLAEMTFDTSNTAVGRLKALIKPYAAATSQRILGLYHPFTKLFHLEPTLEEKAHLQRLLQRRVHESYTRLLPEGSRDIPSEHCFLSVLLMSVGQGMKAAKIISFIVSTFDQSLGTDTLESIFLVLELSKLLISILYLDVAESLVNDALQRIMRLRAIFQPGPTMTSLAQVRIGSLRILCRIQVLRGSHLVGKDLLSQAAHLAKHELGSDADMTQCVDDDLAVMNAILQQVESMKAAGNARARSEETLDAPFAAVEIVLSP